MKKILSLLICLALLCGAASAAETDKPAETYVTRGEFAVKLAEFIGTQAPAEPVFADVPAESPYFDAVGKLYAAGAVFGYEGRFEPDREIIADEAFNMAARLYEPAEILRLGSYPTMGVELATRNHVYAPCSFSEPLTADQCDFFIERVKKTTVRLKEYGIRPGADTTVVDMISDDPGESTFYYSFTSNPTQFSETWFRPVDDGMDVKLKFTTNQPEFDMSVTVFRASGEDRSEAEAVSEARALTVSPNAEASLTLGELLGKAPEAGACYYIELRSDDRNGGGIVRVAAI